MPFFTNGTGAVAPSLETLREEMEELISGEFACFLQEVPHPAHEAITHLMEGGGKRIRPLMALLCAGAAGGAPQAAKPVALAVELLHSGSLLHDDVVDEGEMRRGRPASRKIWGNEVSVLAGDYCIFAAVNALLELDNHEIMGRAMAVGKQLCSGELTQLERRFSWEQYDENTYFEVIEKKTAALIAFACWGGGKAASGNEVLSEHLHHYGRQVGLAFQILDDILDFSSEEEVFGKSLGQDLRDGIMTLPLAYAIEERPGLLAELKHLTKLHESSSNGSGQTLVEGILREVKSSRGLERSRETARQHTADALARLDHAPENQFTFVLKALAQDLQSRIA